jgi:stage II sporulation protein D
VRVTPRFSRICQFLTASVTFLIVLDNAHSLFASAQGDVSDAQLVRASNERALRIGNPQSGRSGELPLEVYVARVLAAEGEPRAADAAQEALAIAIRTYALANDGRHQREGYDLCDTTHCQVVRSSTPASRRAALATAGQILTFAGRPAELFYSASCGGQSESASAVWPGAAYPYLVSAPDDVHADDVPWTLDLELSDIERTLQASGFAGRLTAIELDARSASGRVSRLRVNGMEPDVISGEEFRRAMGTITVKSTAFSVTRTGSGVQLVGRGFGHGVGMCVIGAGRRALRGESAAAILDQYYPGLSLTDIGGALLPRTGVAARSSTNAVASRSSVVVVAGAAGDRGVYDIERLAADAHAQLSRTLGVSVAPITIELHDTLEEFRRHTGQPWWVSAAAAGTAIDLAPLPLLEQRDGVAAAIRIAIADLLVADAMAGRPLWVRVGASRYFGRSGTAVSSAAVRCPADAELKLAVSAAAQRDAEARAEACFAQAYRRTGTWRAVR